MRNGGTLYINSSNLTIETNYLQIDSGGVVTYHTERTKDKAMITTFKVHGDAIIDGVIDFSGKKGSDGVGSGKPGNPGEYGKNIIFKLVIFSN